MEKKELSTHHGFPLWLTGKTSNSPPPTLFLCVEVLKLHRASWRKMATSARIKQYGPLMIWPYNNKAVSCTKWVSQAQCFPSKGSWRKEASKHVQQTHPSKLYEMIKDKMFAVPHGSIFSKQGYAVSGTTLSSKSACYVSGLAYFWAHIWYTLSYTLLLCILSIASSSRGRHLEWSSVHWQSAG